MKLLYIEATHIFAKEGKRYSVTLRPSGEAYVNGELVCEFVHPNTTKTRALKTLKRWQDEQQASK